MFWRKIPPEIIVLPYIFKNDSSVYGILFTRRFDTTARLTQTVNKERNQKLEIPTWNLTSSLSLNMLICEREAHPF